VIRFMITEDKPHCEVDSRVLHVSSQFLKSPTSAFVKLFIRCEIGTVRLVEIVTDDTEEMETRRLDTILVAPNKVSADSFFGSGRENSGSRGDGLRNCSLYLRLRGPANVRGEVHYESI
jgi:hypothetical protein